MRTNVCLLFCMVIVLALLSGCGGGYDNSNLAEGTERTVQSIERTYGEPTPYETVNNLTDVTMDVKEGTVSSTGLAVVFENNTLKQCIYGEFFLIEKKINEKWYQVPVVIDGYYGFNDIGYDLASGEEKEWIADWNWLYGSLVTGEYRIVKDILDFRSTGDYDKYFLVAEFTIH